MAHTEMRRRSALRLCLARYRSRQQWSFLQSQRPSDETPQTLYGRHAPVSLPFQEPLTLAERRWSDED